jgi:hypothetical protein
VGYYLSVGTTITTSDYLVATASQGSLSNGFYVNMNATVDLDNVGGLPGETYYVGFIIDDQSQVSESDENDNAFYFTPTIFYPGGTPNLTLYTGSGSVNNYSYNTSTHVLTVNSSVQNNGAGSAGAFRVGYYLSDNTTISTSDYLVATASQNSLTNGFYVNKTATVDLDNVGGLPSGTYYVGFIIDDQAQVSETDENDNTAYYTPTIDYRTTQCSVIARVDCPNVPGTGGQFTAPIFVNMGSCPSPNDRLGSFTGKLAWNPSLVRFVSHSGLQSGFTGAVNTSSTASGIVDFNGANPSGAAGDVNVLTVTFEVLGAASSTGVLDLSFSAMSAAGTFADLLSNLVTNDCNYTIPAGCKVCGDVNDDGVANSTDALVILSYDVGTPIPPSFQNLINKGCGDVNKDGATNSTDALIILSYDAGIPVPFNVGNPGGC